MPGNPPPIEVGAASCEAEGGYFADLLEEYFAISTRKPGVDAAIARRKVELFSELPMVATHVEDVLAAIDLHRLHQSSFWDALGIRSAQQAGCSRLYSEDLQHGRRIDGVEILNPFR